MIHRDITLSGPGVQVERTYFQPVQHGQKIRRLCSNPGMFPNHMGYQVRTG